MFATQSCEIAGFGSNGPPFPSTRKREDFSHERVCACKTSLSSVNCNLTVRLLAVEAGHFFRVVGECDDDALSRGVHLCMRAHTCDRAR